MSQAQPPPSMLSLARLFGGFFLAALDRAVTYPFRSNRAAKYSSDITYAVIRWMLNNITIPQSRYLVPPVVVTYRSLCKDTGDEPRIIRVKCPNGEVQACWFGNPDAEVVMLYIHGGGYTQPASRVHLDFAHRLVQVLNRSENHKSFAVLFVAYTLAPEATHPTALKEVASVLSYLVDECGKSPTNIVLSGDSAGGGLCFSLLSHLLHPHPQVPEVKLSKPLGGAVLFSPWVDLRTDHDSFERNAHKDVLVRRCLHAWCAMYTGETAKDPEADPGRCPGGDSYTNPASNDSTWWNGMHQVIDHIFIYAGANEVFVDGISAFQDSFRKAWKQGGGAGERILYLEGPNESHGQPVFEWATSESQSQVAIVEWLKERTRK